MADQFLQNIKQSFTLAEIMDHSIEFSNQFPGPNLFLSSPIELSCDPNFSPHLMMPEEEGLGNNLENFPGFFTVSDEITAVTSNFSEPVISNVVSRRDLKRLTMEIHQPQSSSALTSHDPHGSHDNGTKKKKRVGKAKKVKVEKNGEEKPKQKPREVVHVRAKRGEATDSHSLAERVRRRKINERLRCLQDIVPGCYKTMGMTVMLDEIISYVQSLQSQVEFLSMRLTAASTFYDFGLDTDVMAAMQGSKVYEAMNVQNLAAQGHNFAEFAESGLNFSYLPQLPHNI